MPVVKYFCRECYSEPQAVYETLKRAGMDLVTITDHDSIDAAESLRRYPDFFVSEEVTCHMPSGTEVHVGVYDITERDHVEVQRRRNDLPALLAYLNQRDILFSLNHPFSGLTGRREQSDLRWFESDFPVLEVYNGHMLSSVNGAAAALVEAEGKIGIGGSDAHTLLSVGSAFTEVPRARSRAEFIEGIRQNRARVGGQQGSYWKLTRDLYWIGLESIRHCPAALLFSPLLLAVPAGSFINYLLELQFARRWSRFLGRREGIPNPVTLPAPSVDTKEMAA